MAKAVALDAGNREAAALLAALQGGNGHSARPSSAAGAAAAAPKASAAAGSGDGQAAIRRVMAARTYYEMLGVERACSDNDLKKAYRKTSLRVHPDKNSAPGAVQAFQRVTEAFDVLSDARKKEIYDQVGHEQFTQRVQANGAAGAEAAAAGGFPFAGGAQHMSAEELFGMFFRQGGGAFRFNGQRVHMNQFRRGFATNMGGGGGGGGEPRQSWWTFVPLLLLMVVWLSNSLFSGAVVFSLVQSSQFPVQRSTMSVERLEYFVDRRFEEAHPTRQDVLRVEREVRAEWLRVLESNCIYERRERASRLYWVFGDRRRELEAMPLPNCDKLFRVKQDRVTG